MSRTSSKWNLALTRGPAGDINTSILHAGSKAQDQGESRNQELYLKVRWLHTEVLLGKRWR